MVLSLVSGAIFAWFYGKLSNQERIKKVKDSIWANIHEAVLYRHDPVLTIRAQALLLWSGMKYLSTTLVPIAILCVPSIILFTALQSSFGFLSSASKESELLIQVAPDQSPFDYSVRTEPPEALSRPLRISGSRELAYKIKGQPSDIAVVDSRGNSFSITDILAKSSSGILASSWGDALLYGARAMPTLGVERVRIAKSEASMALLGVDFPWYIWSLASILLGGYVAARIFRISF